MTRVEIYTTPTCPWCKKTKAWLKEHDIKYEEYDVSKDQQAQKKMIELSGQAGVPVLDIEGTILVGYNPEQMKKLLKK